MIKYIKSVLWRVAKCLSYIEEARCLKVKSINNKFFTKAYTLTHVCVFVCVYIYLYLYTERERLTERQREPWPESVRESHCGYLGVGLVAEKSF